MALVSIELAGWCSPEMRKAFCSVSVLWLSGSACPHLCVELLKTREHEALLLVLWVGLSDA